MSTSTAIGTKAGEFYFFPRAPEKGKPGGVTVSKRRTLPEGDFWITEYTFGGGRNGLSLWFIDNEKFTRNQRRSAFNAYYVEYPA